MPPDIGEVLKRHTPALLSIDGVVGTGEGEQDGAPCILVLVKRRTPELERAIPSSLEGYPVRIQAVGEVRALDRRK
jgi:hypothetical protein